jgi:hypothetical protein
LRKATIIFVMSVCPSARPSVWNNSAPENFHKIWYLIIFRKSAKKIQVSLKFDNNNGYYAWRPIYQYLTRLFLEWEMFHTKAVVKIKAHISSPVTSSYRKSCRLWDNVEKCCTVGQVTENNMVNAHYLLDTNTHSEYVIITVFPRQQWFRQRAPILRSYVHWFSCYT